MRRWTADSTPSPALRVPPARQSTHSAARRSREKRGGRLRLDKKYLDRRKANHATTAHKPNAGASRGKQKEKRDKGSTRQGDGRHCTSHHRERRWNWTARGGEAIEVGPNAGPGSAGRHAHLPVPRWRAHTRATAARRWAAHAPSLTPAEKKRKTPARSGAARKTRCSSPGERGAAHHPRRHPAAGPPSHSRAAGAATPYRGPNARARTTAAGSRLRAPAVSRRRGQRPRLPPHTSLPPPPSSCSPSPRPALKPLAPGYLPTPLPCSRRVRVAWRGRSRRDEETVWTGPTRDCTCRRIGWRFLSPTLGARAEAR